MDVCVYNNSIKKVAKQADKSLKMKYKKKEIKARCKFNDYIFSFNICISKHTLGKRENNPYIKPP